MSHTADEPIPATVIVNMLNINWNEYSGHIPKPGFLEVNAAGIPERYELVSGDKVVIKVDTPAIEETPIGNWSYVNRITRVLLEPATRIGRQRLYNLIREIRRIVHSQVHNLADYQRIRFVSFNELTNEDKNIWTGRVILMLENNAVPFEITG